MWRKLGSVKKSYAGTAALWTFILYAAIADAHGQSLRREAERTGLLMGTAVRPEQLGEQGYAATLAREYNMVEAEDAMKWWMLRPDAASYDFGPADHMVDFARAHGMHVRGHTLVWDHTNPQWLADRRWTPQELATLLQAHITRVVGHFRGQVFAWDVVNEAFDEHGHLRPSVWYDQPGIGLAAESTRYIEQAFRWAHAADPDALLFYNEAEVETYDAKSEAVVAMVKDFRRRGVPIDGVGLQMHERNMNPDFERIQKTIARFAALGVQVHITELDVALPADAQGKALDPEDLARQAEVYRRIAQACLAQPRCTAIQTWGFTDKYSWVRSSTKGAKGAALPFDRNYTPKPAYDVLKAALAGRH
jgi:endo-1,4-beta-xylanase